MMGKNIRHRIRHRMLHIVYDVVGAYDIVYDMQHTMSYTMSYVFAYHRLRPLKWLARVFHDEPCISHCIFIYSHKIYMILSVHCAAAHDVRACAALSPTHTVTINIYHFQGRLCTDHLLYTLTVHWSCSAPPQCLCEVTPPPCAWGRKRGKC